jgi:transposase-like protein
MTKKKYRRYSAEFKQHALRRASEDGVTDKEVCEDLGVSERQLRRWRVGWSYHRKKKWQSSGAGLQRRNRNGIF